MTPVRACPDGGLFLICFKNGFEHLKHKTDTPASLTKATYIGYHNGYLYKQQASYIGNKLLI